MTPADWQALSVTLQLCLWTTAILLVVGTPLAWWLAFTRARWRPAVEAIVALPLVLPPTVLGFYLLVALGPHGPLGRLSEAAFGRHFAFSFEGILIGSVLYSLPFTVQPLADGFRSLGPRTLEVAATLGASFTDRFTSIVLPLTRGAFLTAATLTFAHTLGEFGVILMIGGSIPGETQVLSIAIYDAAESLDYARAHRLSAGLLAASFVILCLLFAARRRIRLT
jgi:molybdate transport system permease protein